MLKQCPSWGQSITDIDTGTDSSIDTCTDASADPDTRFDTGTDSETKILLILLTQN